MKEKICSLCNIKKNITEFHKGIGKYNRRAMCSKCCNSRYNTEEKKIKANLYRKNLRKNKKYRDFENKKQKERDDNNIERYLIRIAKSRAKKYDIEFNINVEDIIIPEYCPLLNIKLAKNRGIKNNSYSLDRINPNKGYIKNNIKVISHRANMLKNNANLKELELLVKNLKNYWTH